MLFKIRVEISIHAPREGCDTLPVLEYCHATAFQSTHPVRGATVPSGAQPRGLSISIHAPREGCDAADFDGLGLVVDISIHAPREGCDREPRQQST